MWAINIITLYTTFFFFVNEKKSCTKTQEEIKFKGTRFSFSSAYNFLFSGDLCFWSMSEISERVACHS